MTAALLVLTALIAVVDWVAVDRGRHDVERIAKPLTLVALIAVALSADLGDAKVWVIAALVFGLAGDIALMYAKDDESADEPVDAAFLAGLGSFLAGHVCYIVAFTRYGLDGWQLLAGVLVVGGIAALALPAVIRGANRQGGQQLAGAVGIYAGALGAMAVLGVGTGTLAAAGGVLFLASDSILARERFVAPFPRGPLAVIVTYHLAQALIVVGMMD